MPWAAGSCEPVALTNGSPPPMCQIVMKRVEIVPVPAPTNNALLTPFARQISLSSLECHEDQCFVYLNVVFFK